MRSMVALWLLLSAGFAMAGPSATARLPKGKAVSAAGPRTASYILDTALVHALYLDCEFDSAIGILEQARRQGGLRTRADSIFAFKYLAVMYAATYATVEMGKQLMVLLLRIDPSAGILDMHASDMIYMIFRNVQSEMAHSGIKPGTDQGPPSKPDSSALAPKPRTRSHRWLYWTTGSAALAAGVGTILYFTLSDPDPREGAHYEGGLP